jgi:carbon storage regulator
MLVLSRKKTESIVINDKIVITVLSVRGDRVSLGIKAPSEIPVLRLEVYESQHGSATPDDDTGTEASEPEDPSSKADSGVQ